MMEIYLANLKIQSLRETEGQQLILRLTPAEARAVSAAIADTAHQAECAQ